MRVGVRILLGWFVAAVLLSSETDDRSSPSAMSEQDTSHAGKPQFDPFAVAPGDTILGLRITSKDVDRSPTDSSQATGEVLFEGSVTLTGIYKPHPAFPELDQICFYPDAASAQRLPAFPGDERTTWMCFTNQDRASQLLAPLPDTGRATVIVDRFHYVYEFSDVYNMARLADVQE